MTQTNTTVALIIGGSSGMGRATAERLLKRGVGVHLVARDTERLSKAKEELSSLGSVRATGVDLYDETAARLSANPTTTFAISSTRQVTSVHCPSSSTGRRTTTSTTTSIGRRSSSRKPLHKT